AFFAVEAGVGVAGGLVDGAFEVGVAEAAVAAAAEEEAGAGVVHVGDDGFLVLVEDLGADGDLEDDVGAVGAVAVAAHAVAAGLGLEVLLISIIDEGVEAVDGLDPDVAAAAAVAAVGAAVLDELL